jgi:6-phosphofructokinase 2
MTTVQLFPKERAMTTTELPCKLAMVTLNTAVDEHIRYGRPVAGGGGINNWRAALTLAKAFDVGGAVIGCGFVGAADLDTPVFRGLTLHNQRPILLPCSSGTGQTRRNYIVFDEHGRETTRFGSGGYEVRDSDLELLTSTVLEHHPTEIVLSGSLPKGAERYYVDIIELMEAQDTDVEFDIDTRGEIMKSVLDALKAKRGGSAEGIRLKAKMNLEEFNALGETNLEPTDPAGLLSQCGAILPDGTVVCSLGRDNGIFVREPSSRAYQVRLPHPPFIRFKTSNGCGDTLFGCIALALAFGGDLLTAVKWGIACATAQVENFTPGLFSLRTARRLKDGGYIQVVEVN